MDKEQKRADPKIEIADEVIATLVSQAIGQVSGVRGLSGKTRDIFSRKPSRRAIKIDFISPEEIALDLHLVFDYGFSIPEVAGQVQTAVTRELQASTKLKVKQVNIYAEDIVVPKK